MLRRNFIQALGVSALAAAQEVRIGKADIKLGVASYSFRKFNRAQAIRMTRELGTPYLNVKDVHLPLNSTPEQIGEARREFTSAGIQLVGCGNISFLRDDEVDMRAKFEYARLAGFPLIVCAPTSVTLPKLERFVKEYDIKVAVHNHGPEDSHFPTPQSVLDAVAGLDPRCGLCMDIGHTARTGANIVESIKLAGARLLDMHIKDLADPMSKESQVPVGQGKLPVSKIFAQLSAIGYRGSVNLEYEIQADNPEPGMRESFNYMRQVLHQLQAA